MEVGTVANSVLQLPSHSEALHSLWVPNSSSSLHGPATMVNFEDGQGEITKERQFFTQIDKEETSNDDFDSCFLQPEKKRRLLPNQVKFLERSFEADNKLEPDRKVQLAKELGLQPRQIAIWFQNRRARYKTKQIEKDYDVLKASFDQLKSDYDNLFKENESLRNEIHLLKGNVHKEEKGKENSEESEAPISPTDAKDDAEKAKSDIVDSYSPQYNNNHSSSAFLEPANSSNVFEPDPSDFSQDEDDTNLSKNFLCFPEVGQPNSCFQIEDQPCWFTWQY